MPIQKLWRCKEEIADYVWVLDPIDGTKSFITDCTKREVDWFKWATNYLEWARNLHTKLFKSFKSLPVKVPLYGCDCYAYALLASGFVNLVIESGLKPYDFLALVPVIESAGGTITDWTGQQFNWKASAGSPATSFNVVAAGDKQVHQQALDALQWH